MTDLERVRDALEWHEYGNQDERRRLAFLELDAHLKEDAGLADWTKKIEAKLSKTQAELARLRESMAAYDRLLREAEAERDRLREGWGKEIENAERLANENRRLRDVVESYVASGPTNQELRDLYIEEHNENARLREDRDLGKRMFDDLELQAQDYEAELDRLREEEFELRQDINELVSEKVELHAENARLRERVKELEAYASAMRGSDV